MDRNDPTSKPPTPIPARIDSRERPWQIERILRRRRAPGPMRRGRQYLIEQTTSRLTLAEAEITEKKWAIVNILQSRLTERLGTPAFKRRLKLSGSARGCMVRTGFHKGCGDTWDQLKCSRPHLLITPMTAALHKPMVKPPPAGSLPCQARESPLMSHDQDRYPTMPAMYSFDSRQLYTCALSKMSSPTSLSQASPFRLILVQGQKGGRRQHMSTCKSPKASASESRASDTEVTFQMPQGIGRYMDFVLDVMVNLSLSQLYTHACKPAEACRFITVGQSYILSFRPASREKIDKLSQCVFALFNIHLSHPLCPLIMSARTFF